MEIKFGANFIFIWKITLQESQNSKFVKQTYEYQITTSY